MANTRDIRRRIKSVKNTSQITRAMQLVAASKMKKAQDQALAGRRYAEEMNKVLVNLRDGVEDDAHALFEVRESKRELMIVITTDKGLCGGLNTNLLRKVTEDSVPETEFATVGNKGKQALARTQRKLVADFSVSDPVIFAEVKSIRAGKINVSDAFARVEGGEVWLHNFHIGPYEQANQFNVDPDRPRKLLLHRAEIRKLVVATEEKGLTLVPLAIYFSKGRAKATLALARGRKLYDKREKMKRQTQEREAERAIRGRD